MRSHSSVHLANHATMLCIWVETHTRTMNATGKRTGETASVHLADKSGRFSEQSCASENALRHNAQGSEIRCGIHNHTAVAFILTLCPLLSLPCAALCSQKVFRLKTSLHRTPTNTRKFMSTNIIKHSKSCRNDTQALARTLHFHSPLAFKSCLQQRVLFAAQS